MTNDPKKRLEDDCEIELKRMIRCVKIGIALMILGTLLIPFTSIY